MKHPPYHLKVNKAIDRFLLMELLHKIMARGGIDITEYTYYGFGGPFLEDFRLIHGRCPEIDIVSIERDLDTFKRQQFHRFSTRLDLKREKFDSFVAHFSSTGREIFWLDYTNLELKCFDSFKSVLQKVSERSVVKITVRAELPSNAGSNSQRRERKWREFQQTYNDFLPDTARRDDIERLENFLNLLLAMFELASQQSFAPCGGTLFQPLVSSYYKDQTRMLSITGIVCKKDELLDIKDWFNDWKFLNLEWNAPRNIDVPILSIKERLHLERELPTGDVTGTTLSNALDYKIADEEDHIEQMKQYEDFHQYYPFFARIAF